MDGSALKKVRRINIIAFVSVVLFMFIINSMVPYSNDDWHYMFVLHSPDYDYELKVKLAYLIPDVNERLVSSFADVLTSTKNQYLVMGGRAINHFFLILFLWLADKWLFNIVNSIVFALLGYFIYRFAAPKKRETMPWLLPLIYLLTFLMPDMGSNVFWMAGAFNYLWPSVLITGTWLVMRRCFYGESRLKYALMLPLVFAASATNEVSGGMMGVVLLVWFLADENKKKNFFRYLFCVLIFLAGEAFVLAAPGNFNRAENFNGVKLGDKTRILSTCKADLMFVINNYGWMFIIMAALWLYFRPLFKRSDVRMLSYAVGGFAGAVAYGLSGLDDMRVQFYPAAMIFTSFAICAVRLYKELCTEQSDEVKEYIAKNKVRITAVLAVIIYLILVQFNYWQFVIYTLVFGYTLLWLYLYSRKTGGFGKITLRGLFDYAFEKAWLIMAGIMVIPWVYLLAAGKIGFDGALSYTTVGLKVCAVMFVVWFLRWCSVNGKIEKPKNKKILSLIEKVRSDSFKEKYYGTGAKKRKIVIVLCLAYFAANMVYKAADATVRVAPYYAQARGVYADIEKASKTDDKVYHYTANQFLLHSGNGTMFSINHASLEVSHIPAGWIEVYYGVIIKGDGPYKEAWSTNRFIKQRMAQGSSIEVMEE